MTVDATLASVSNVLVYSAMTVYAGALAAFATDLAGFGQAGGRARVGEAVEPEPALVGAAVPGARRVAGDGTDLAGRPSADPGSGDVDADRPVRVRRAASIAVSLSWLAFLLHAGAVVTRGLSAQRVPWANMYEFSLTGSAVVTGVFLLVLARRDLRFLGTFVIGPALLTLGLAVVVLYTESAQVVPALQSYWLVIHVSIAFVASALLTIAFSATVLQLVQGRREDRRAAGEALKGGRFMDALPASAELEQVGHRLVAVAFPLWTFTLVAGAIWAEKAWGRYWGWDPKEVWTFVIWVVYAAYLHARATRGWDGRRAAYLSMAGFACVLVNFLVVNVFFSGQHSYAGIG